MENLNINPQENKQSQPDHLEYHNDITSADIPEVSSESNHKSAGPIIWVLVLVIITLLIVGGAYLANSNNLNLNTIFF